MNAKHFSIKISIFHNVKAPEEGFLVGYASHLAVHYLVHAYPPPKNFFKALWVNHSVHHYKDGEVVFGVSSPLWDYIYGTMKLKESEDGNNSHGDLGVA